MRLSADAKGRLKSGNRFSDGLMFAFGFGNAQGSLKVLGKVRKVCPNDVITAQAGILLGIVAMPEQTSRCLSRNKTPADAGVAQRTCVN